MPSDLIGLRDGGQSGCRCTKSAGCLGGIRGIDSVDVEPCSPKFCEWEIRRNTPPLSNYEASSDN
jgi:hypothetical protein